MGYLTYLSNPGTPDLLVTFICGGCVGTLFGSLTVSLALWMDRKEARKREKEKVIQELWDEMRIVWKE